MRTFLMVFLVAAFLGACGKKQEKEKAAVQKAAPAPAAEPAVLDTLPALPQAAFEDLIRNLDRTDIVFYINGLSAGGEGENARAFLGFVQGGLPLVRKKICSASGRIDFYGQGNTLSEAEFYLGSACNYYVFTYQGKKYGAMMTPEGIDFLSKIAQRDSQ